MRRYASRGVLEWARLDMLGHCTTHRTHTGGRRHAVNVVRVAAVLLESTAPDWIVWVIAGVRRGRKVMHRGMRASWPLWGFLPKSDTQP